ncbi:MAG: hypothetical protein JWO94_785 [Verrucomicrobiaceae bacterium]|nr:hypothetical protein [Verrucomicrobiaceae bacterium]
MLIRSRSLRRVFDWLKLTRSGGLELLLTRDKPGPRAGEPRLLKDKPQIAQGLAEGRWKSTRN